jgi:hypothetical protein
MAVPTPRDNFKIFIGSTDGVQIGIIAACETRANARERPPTYYTALQAHITGWHWPALARSGAGDGNRIYRWFRYCSQIGKLCRVWSAACDLRVQTPSHQPMPASAAIGDENQWAATNERVVLNDAMRLSPNGRYQASIFGVQCRRYWSPGIKCDLVRSRH